jgi:squalene-hopene/tetraprenyl-beta-curcumene cyclase
MQSRSGGWGAFDVDNEAYWLYKLPFCDFGKVTDEPSADVTAHALEALAPRPASTTSAPRARLAAARAGGDGSWFGRWGVNHVYGTGAACRRSRRGHRAGHPAFRRAVAWLDSVQNEDGGFGEDIRSYADPAWRGRGRAPFPNGWALLAYVAADEAGRRPPRAANGCARSNGNGDWEEAQFTARAFRLTS